MKSEAEFLRLGLKSGLVSLEEVEKWAGERFELNQGQDEILSELVIAKLNGKYETGQFLSQIQGETDWQRVEEKIRERVNFEYTRNGKAHTVPLIRVLSIIASDFPESMAIRFEISILEDRLILFQDGLYEFGELDYHFANFILNPE